MCRILLSVGLVREAENRVSEVERKMGEMERVIEGSNQSAATRIREAEGSYVARAIRDINKACESRRWNHSAHVYT